MSGAVLAFDTSGPWCAAALMTPGGLLTRAEETERGQAERLLPLLEEMLGEAGIGWHDVGRFGVGTGPGNFTGVRIAVATGRALALAAGVPAVGVTRLEALAEGLPRPCLVALDARRGESYVQEFPAFGTEAPRLLAAGEVPDLAGLAAITGDAEWLAGRTSVPMPGPKALAAAIARIAATRADTPAPAPLYLRAADAAPPRDPPPRILP